MESSANQCPVCFDSTASPGMEVLCWDTKAFTRIKFTLSGIAGGLEIEVVSKPDGEVLATIDANGTYQYTVLDSSAICLRVLVSGTGQTCAEAYLYDANITVVELCLPFYLLDGMYSPIPLIGFELPFFLLDGSPSPIPVVPC